MRLSAYHLEERYEYIQGVSNCQNDHLGVVFKVHGASEWKMGFVYPTDEVSIGGEKSNFKYSAGSGLILEIDFCSHCGTKVASRPEIVDGLTYIPAGFLKNEMEFAPQVEILAYNKYKCFGDPETLVESFDHNGTLERISAVIEAMNQA